ncbi:MAG TPA: carboxypeptidase regulatory-like domain-containing protein [Blastocatellia bacterium]|nr:carboxypeptidase regulatory-like domain-containing protein [Blastocatellia bacterium]
MRKSELALCALVIVLSASMFVFAQTASTSTVSGTITDATGAVIAGAEVEMTDLATNQSRKVVTNAAGQYQFPSIPPGTYKVTATAKGFKQAIIPALKVDVAKSLSLDLSLQVGTVGEVVEITAGAAVELQKLDATVGNVIGGDLLKLLPSLTRDATALLNLQPMVTPGRNEGDGTGGQVAGARSDQNTFQIDGGDATSNTEGNGGYNSGFSGTPRAVVPTPAESLEEFRVSTNNQNATFGRSVGGQVQMVTRRGTNQVRGSLYWYHQNDNLNANTWTRNRLHQANPELKDNRYGVSLGGPIWRDKMFIFGHYEGRRFPQSAQIGRLVPSATLRQGILRFRDAGGNVVSYNLATAKVCGPTGDQACDPRGKGLSPVVKSVFDLLPAGNDTTFGDGLNTVGFSAPVALTFGEDFGVTRYDWNINEKWQFMASYRYGKTTASTPSQVDITGGKVVSTSQRPLAPRYFVVGLTTQLTSTMNNEFRFNFLRHWWEWATKKPAPQASGTAAALQIFSESATNALVPYNIDTQNARGRIWNGKDYTFQDNLNWVKGNHTFQFGGRITHQRFFHQRDDKVVGGLTSLIYQVNRGSNIAFPSTYRPPTCGGAITANCLASGDVTRWNNLYVAATGMVDRAVVLLTRDGQFNPNPPGTPLREFVNVNAYEAYANDIWRLGPSLTLSLGLTYNVQLPPVEDEGKQTLMVDAASGKILDAESYLAARKAAAEAGGVYNPTIGFLPVGKTGRKYPYDPDYNNFGPRIAAAWNPDFKEGWLARVFGSRKSVFRGGYSISYDRVNGVGIVMIPILGVGYGQLFSCQGPDLTGKCNPGGGLINPANAFRIGVDGSSVPLPAVAPITLPITPGIGTAPFETLSFQIDPKREIGRSQNWDFTLQRELPWNMLVEFGYVGRHADKLYQGLELNQIPFFMKDKVSGQTFAQAFDAVGEALRTGRTPASQPWFENMLKGSAFCAPSCTAGVVDIFGDSIQSGYVYDVFRGINSSLITGPAINGNQLNLIYQIASLGRSNYHAFFFSLQKRFSRGLTFTTNYTLSHSLDQIGINQSNLNSTSNAYDLNYDYGPSIFDRRHTFNASYLWELPFGKGRMFSTSNRVLDTILGGWYTSGIFYAASGLPLTFYEDACQEWGAGIFGNCSGMIPLRNKYNSGSVHSNVVGSGGIGINSDPKSGGSGLNLFANPEAVYNSFRQISVSRDTRDGRDSIRGLNRWNFDLSLGKEFRFTERIKARFSADFVNIFNHPLFGDPGMFWDDPANFGVINSQYNQPRYIQMGLRIEF